MDALDVSRWQFGITTVYHFILVPLTIGLAPMIAVMQTVWHVTGNEQWLRATKFFGKLGSTAWDLYLGRMPEQLGGESIVESTGLVQRPQSVQGGPAGFGLDLFSQLGISHGDGALAQQAHGGLPVPLVWVRQKPDELLVGFCAKIGVGNEWLGLGSEPVNAAGGGVDLALVMLAVRDVALIKIGD